MNQRQLPINQHQASLLPSIQNAPYRQLTQLGYIYETSHLLSLACVYIYIYTHTHTLIILTLLYSCFDLNLIFEFRHQSNEFMNANVYDPQYFNHMQPQAYSLLRYLLCN